MGPSLRPARRGSQPMNDSRWLLEPSQVLIHFEQPERGKCCLVVALWRPWVLVKQPVPLEWCQWRYRASLPLSQPASAAAAPVGGHRLLTWCAGVPSGAAPKAKFSPVVAVKRCLQPVAESLHSPWTFQLAPAVHAMPTPQPSADAHGFYTLLLPTTAYCIRRSSRRASSSPRTNDGGLI